MGRFAAWSVGLSLAFVGSQIAHALTYAAVAPDANRRAQLLEQSGHSYFAYHPFVWGLLVALLGLVARVVVTERRSAALGWPIALLPALAFVVQEHLERLEHQVQFPWHALVEPTFLPGLVLQLPLGILAYVVARLAARCGEARRVPARAGETRPCSTKRGASCPVR